MNYSCNSQIRLLFVSFLTFLCLPAFCQYSVGLSSGYAINRSDQNISDRSFTSLQNGAATSIGFFINYKVNENVDLQTGIEKTGKKFTIKRTGIYSGVFTIFSNSYLQIPITTKLNIFRRRDFFLQLDIGIFVGYWVKAKVKGKIPNVYDSMNDTLTNNSGQRIQNIQLTSYSTNHRFSKRIDNRLEAGCLAGATINYQLNGDYLFYFAFDYYHALSSQQKKYAGSQSRLLPHNQTLVGSVGCLLLLNKKL